MPYYIPNTVSKTTCLGNSLSTFNISFTSLDTNLYNLSSYSVNSMNYLSSTMVSVSSELTTKINYLSSTMISVSGNLVTQISAASSFIMTEMNSLSSYAEIADTAITYVSANVVDDYIRQGIIYSDVVDGGTINWDISSTGNNVFIFLQANAALANPTSLSAGQTGNLVINIFTAGKQLTSFGSMWTFSNNYSSLNTTANARNIVSYYYDGGMIWSSMMNF